MYCSHLLKHLLSNKKQGVGTIVVVSLIKFQTYVNIEQRESHSPYLSASFLDTLFSFWRRLFS